MSLATKNAMPPLRRHLIAIVLATLATGGGLAFVQHRRVAELDRLRFDNARLRTQIHRQATATESVAPVQPDAVAMTPAVEPAAVYPEPAALERYFDEGQATPIAALQTLAWAGDRGDVERLRGLIRFDPEARAMAEAYWATLPPETQARFGGDLAAMAATLLTRAIMRAPYPEAGILAAAQFAPVEGRSDRVRLQLPDTPKHGQIFAEEHGQWGYMITPELVRAYLAENRSGGQ